MISGRKTTTISDITKIIFCFGCQKQFLGQLINMFFKGGFILREVQGIAPGKCGKKDKKRGQDRNLSPY